MGTSRILLIGGVNYKMHVLIASPLNETQRLLLYDFPRLIDET